MAKKTTTKTKIDKATIELVERRAYWRKVAEMLVAGVFPHRHQWDRTTSGSGYVHRPRAKGNKPKTPTLGDALASMPPEWREAVLELPLPWLVALLGSAEGGVEENYMPWMGSEGSMRDRPAIAAIRAPKAVDRPDKLDTYWIEVEPPELPPRLKDKPKKKKSSTKKASKKTSKGGSKAKRTTSKKAAKKSSTAKPKSSSSAKRRSADELDAELLELGDLKVGDGMTKAQIRAELGVSGGVVNKLLERAKANGLVQNGTGRKALYRWRASSDDGQGDLLQRTADEWGDEL